MSGLNKKYVIGVDGGGTKTKAALAEMSGKIIKRSVSGPSNPRNIGVDSSVKNISKAVKKLLNKNVRYVYIGIPAVYEEYKNQIYKIRKGIIREIGFSKIEVSNDQILAFRAGTDEKQGVLAIAGTGSVACAFKNGKKIKTSGWGWLNDEGSAIFTGLQVFRNVLKDIDKRGNKTLMTKFLLKELRAKDELDILRKVYSNPTQTLASFSKIADMAALKKDRIAESILKKSAEEIILNTQTVIKQARFKKKFPLVLAGGMFNSKIIFDIFSKEFSSKTDIILLEESSVKGAVKLALEKI